MQAIVELFDSFTLNWYRFHAELVPRSNISLLNIITSRELKLVGILVAFVASVCPH